jgi:hypothetical protein
MAATQASSSAGAPASRPASGWPSVPTSQAALASARLAPATGCTSTPRTTSESGSAPGAARAGSRPPSTARRARADRNGAGTGVAYSGHPRSPGCSPCSRRGWPAEAVAHPTARRRERDPQRIADDHQEQGGSRWQAHRHGASRLVTVTDNGRRPSECAHAHPPHHVPVHWLPGYQDHRGQDDRQRPHGNRDSRLSDRPCVLHPASIGRARPMLAEVAAVLSER